jgi:putative flippase GtrA
VSTFPRSALTSIFTTSLDFALLTALVEAGHVNYVLATCLGTILGASTNFLINRRWAFRATAGHAGHQALRYLLVQIGSAALHTSGVWALTHFVHVRYWLSKIVVAVAAYLVWNYPMNRWFVFSARTRRSTGRLSQSSAAPRVSRLGA